MANAPNKKSYEEQWQEAFNQAEMPPSPNVWKNIDQQLTAQESGKYRKGFFFYRAVAAVLLLCIAGLGWYILSQPDDSRQIAQENKPSTEQSVTPLKENENGQSLANGSAAQITDQAEGKEKAQSALAENSQKSNGKGAQSPSNDVADAPSGDDNPPTDNIVVPPAHEINQLASENSNEPASAAKTLIFPNEEVSLREEQLLSINHRVERVTALPPDEAALNSPNWVDEVEKLYYVPQYRKEKTLQKERSNAQFFAGLAMAPSLFDPNFQTQGSPKAAVAAAESPVADMVVSYALAESFTSGRSLESNTVVVADGLENQSLVSLTYGFDMGVNLGEHWSIESGLDYQNFQTVTDARYSVIDLESGERYPLLATNAVANQATAFNTAAIGSPSEVDNQFQFISIPLRVGYNLRFSRVTLSLSPGIAANLFLGNRISSQDFASTTLSNDGSSPFNSRYISGLVSGGVFYQLLDNYSLSFSPSYQFALSDFARTSATFNSLPQSLGLKFGFRYNFR